MASITQQEKGQYREALKAEIARASKLIDQYKAKIAQYEGLQGGETEIGRCQFEIRECEVVIKTAAAELGIKPTERRGPGRPPKDS